VEILRFLLIVVLAVRRETIPDLATQETTRDTFCIPASPDWYVHMLTSSLAVGAQKIAQIING
jgi:hypothetical protein